MYKLYTDKPTDFKCHIELEGAGRDEVDARLVVESNDKTLLYRGSINKNGECKIPIGELKGLIEAGTTGTMALEVIAGETYFQPWSSPFKVISEQKISVEVYTPGKDVTVSMVDERLLKATPLVRKLRKKGVTSENALRKRNRKFIKEQVIRYCNKHSIDDTKKVLRNVIQAL